MDRTESAGYLTNWAARLYARAVDRELRPLGLSSAHLPVFFALADGVELAQKNLAEVAAVEQPTMAATLARMERDGLVERRPHPDDGRSSLVRLTSRATAKAEEVRSAIGRVNAASLSALSHQERGSYRDMMLRVIASLETAVAGGGN